MELSLSATVDNLPLAQDFVETLLAAALDYTLSF